MKYNVLGFYQPRAVELGLCSDDLLVLRWFVDFAGTPKMRTMIIDNQIYYWVNYSTVLDELPILRISKQTLYKKHFTNLCNANVLTHKQVKEGGNFSYYCYGINYETLVYLQSEETPLVKNNDLVSKSNKGSVEIEQTLVSKSNEQRLNNNIINLQDNNKKEIYKEKVEQSPTHTQSLKEEKHKYGEYNHILLTDKELNHLKDEIGEKNTESAIKLLDEAIEMKGYKYKSHYLAIRKWVLTSLKQQGKWVDVPVKSVRVINDEEEKAKQELDEKFKNDPNAEKEFAEFMKSRKLDTNIFKEF